MEKWEYLEINARWNLAAQAWRIEMADEPAYMAQSLGHTLNKAGDAGWELISMVPLNWEPLFTNRIGTSNYGPAYETYGGGRMQEYQIYFKRRTS